MSSGFAGRRLISSSTKWNSKPLQARIDPGLASKGVKIVNCSSASKVKTQGLLIKASSRQENYGNSGLSHAMRIATGLASKNYSAFLTTRKVQQAGASLQVSQGREYTFYSVQGLEESSQELVYILLDKVILPSFKPWEVHENMKDLMEIELMNLSPDVITSEGLHNAAFRNGLGQSLFVPPRNIDLHSSVDMREWHNKYYNTANTTLVVDSLNNVDQVMNDVGMPEGQSTQSTPSKFHPGSENRTALNGPNAYIAIATGTAGFADTKEAAASMILQRILGARVPTKRGVGAGKLQVALKAVLGDTPYGVSGINYNYSDAGLLGAYLAVDAVNAGKATEAVVKALRSLKINENEVLAAKKQLILDNLEMSPLAKAEQAAYHAAFDIDFFAEDLNASINAITAAQVQGLASKLASGKYAMSAYGNLSNVPYLDTL